ncbi:holo-ACP synthase [Mucilaginibacter sp. SJ]|uniref:holo-ACP synthase n=1 Tax=Mucilaginibacter sp. SJ TaxID=3029053 RepID=UPI0023A9B203|nr:holo-ACP synthase [Mucilaginibacter sp. SJ]WDZ99694.1 holo-ACP synthase [Mucilaginibacter sp. SJ]
MIVGIGCDVVDHLMTRKLNWSTNFRVQKRIFSVKEIDLSLSHDHKTDRFFSGRFAVKEAVLKCLGTGMRDGIALTDIQVLQTVTGQPFIEIEGEIKRISEQMGIVNWHVSISHTDNSTCAFVVAEK